MTHNKKNIITGIIVQLMTMISGLILPRLIITTLGSEVNGLVSSITYFLSFISLLEGGLGAVVLSELYKPIKDKDDEKIKEILVESQNFFIKLGIVYIIFTVVLSVIYPMIVTTSFSFGYVSTLVMVLSLSTLIQYLFALTNRLYLQANQEVFIVNITQSIIIFLNLCISIVIIYVYPEIHIIKLISSILFIVQPIVYKHYIDRKFNIPFRLHRRNTNVLKNRWGGFSQHLAHFINLNTDVVAVTLFIGVAEVSVYSVYMLAITALRTFISLLSGNYQSALGKYYADGDMEVLRNNFHKFNIFNWQISVIAFNTCLLLINQFVQLYTYGVYDVNYYQPIFAVIMTIAYLCFCIREPYRYMVLSAGKFKETSFGSMMEAILNIVISIALVFRFGLIGIAIGTFIALLYRLIYLMKYCDNHFFKISVTKDIPFVIATVFLVSANLILYLLVDIEIKSIIEFIIYGTIIVVGEGCITFSVFRVISFFVRHVDGSNVHRNDMQ